MKSVVAWLRVIGLLAVEAALFALLWFAGPVMGTVGWSNPHAWLADSTPQGAVTALIRVFGLIGSGWVLATSLLWVLAGLAGLRGLQARFGRLTLPMVRRLLQPVAGLSMLASVALSSGVASALAPPATAHVLTVGSNPLQQKAPVSEAALPDSVPVSASAIGRHIAHPGVIDHKLPAPGLGATATSAPSLANGFAGLKAGTKVYVVQPGDCLSVIAEEHLGDWRLDLVIDDMNRGRLQPDGRALVDEHWIYPGWVLVMPQDATGAGVMTVAHGHTAAVPAAPKHEQKHGAQHLKAKSEPGSETRHATAPAGSLTPITAAPVQTTTPLVPTTDVPTTAVPVTPTTVGQPVPSVSVPAHTASRPGTDQRDVSSKNSGPVVPLPGELLGAGILAAGLVALLRKLDNVRKGRRRLGRPVILQRSGEEARAELAARVGADADALLAVDRGLRFFASLVRRQALVVPEVLAVELAPGSLTVLFASVPSQPPRPWSMGPDGMSWALDRSFALPASDEVAPFPALVSLGESEDKSSRVLVNLEAAGVLSFVGVEKVALEVAASMAVELATVPWAQECRLYLYGLGRPEGLGVAEPVNVVEDLSDIVELLEATAAATRQAVGSETGTRSLGELRLSSDDPVDLGPVVVICAAPAGPELMRRLTELAEDPTSGVVAVLTTEGAAREWLLEVDLDGIAEVGPLARRVRLQRLSMPVFDAVQRRLENALPPVRAHELDLTPQEAGEAPETPGCNLAADWWEPPAGSVAEEEEGDDEPKQTGTADEEPDDVVATSGPELSEAEGPSPDSASGEDVIELSEIECASGDEPPGRPSLVRLVPELVRPQGLAPVLTEQGASVIVQVLHGFPRIWRVDGGEPEEIVVPRLRSLEAIVYLALRQDASGVSSHRLAEAMHPEKVKDGRKANDQTFATEMTTARKALGTSSDGTQLLPPKAATGGKFLLSERVITDWSVLRDLLHKAEEPAGALADEELYQLVSKAFSLVGDEAPFAEVRRRATDARRRTNGGGGGEAEHWRWVDIEHASIDDDVADTAAWTAKFANEYRHHHEARVAAHLGLKVSPVREDLCEELLKAENALGGTRAVQKAWDDIERSFEDHAEPYDVVPNELRHTYNRLVSSLG